MLPLKMLRKYFAYVLDRISLSNTNNGETLRVVQFLDGSLRYVSKSKPCVSMFKNAWVNAASSAKNKALGCFAMASVIS